MTEKQPERPDREQDVRTGRDAARNRMQNQAKYVDLQIQQAMRRGDFDNLPGAGKPIRGLGKDYDPDWWVKQLIEREKITGVLPPALQLRKDDAELEAHLDSLHTAADVREEVEEFNARVIKARYTPVDGPPLITQPRDVDTEVEAWRARRAAQRAGPKPQPTHTPPKKPRRRGWFRR
ncbi:MAG TPA: DUF1992 domain-containing protein [Nocardioides sp.]|nr:DUF1992 domain-containing protein [Nocardioides sp.]